MVWIKDEDKWISDEAMIKRQEIIGMITEDEVIFRYNYIKYKFNYISMISFELELLS